jgi:hypothetical protein
VIRYPNIKLQARGLRPSCPSRKPEDVNILDFCPSNKEGENDGAAIREPGIEVSPVEVSRLVRIGNAAAIFPEFKMWKRRFACDAFYGCVLLGSCPSSLRIMLSPEQEGHELSFIAR